MANVLESLQADAIAARNLPKNAVVTDMDSSEEEEVQDDPYHESEDDDDAPDPLPPAPPVLAKLYAVPRNYKRVFEIGAEVDGKRIITKPIGPDYGMDSGSKFLSGCVDKVGTTYFCVPYDARKVLTIGVDSGEVVEVGKKFKHDGAKWTNAVVSVQSHGKLYAAPCRAQRVLEIDTKAGTIKEIGKALGSKSMNKWIASAPSCGGRIYAIPYDAPRVLEIDPNRGGETRLIGPDLGTLPGKYSCVTEAPNGNLYAAPLNARQVLEIDTVGNVRLVGPDLGDTERKYACIVQAPNRLLYAPPMYADRVLEINCARGDTREIGDILGTGEAKYACACVAPVNGKVYCAPLEARRVLEIDCDYHEVAEIGVDLGGTDIEKFSSICAAPEPQGRLYAAPRNGHYFIEICPRRQFVREVGPDMGRQLRKFTCIIPGAIWQGGMHWEDYKVYRQRVVDVYLKKVEEYQKRKDEKEALVAAEEKDRVNERVAAARRKSLEMEAESRGGLKQLPSRNPSQVPSKLGSQPPSAAAQ
mmetsp:Transcript_108116/g.170934  ORF Transcript_108116/g.170934 Transcript_108116/m.170934 type:complete len:528 (+) Transcript_108116:94-1677(+)